MLLELQPDGERAMGAVELRERGARLAGWLDSSGVRARDRVAYLLDNSIPIFEIGAACRMLGAFPVPINYHASADEARYVLEDSGARALVTSHHHAERVARAARGLRALEGQSLVVGGAGDGLADYDKALASATPYNGELRPAPGVVIYTSGTTGQPKGVMRDPATPERARRFLRVFRDVCKLGEAPVHLVTGPLYHSAPNTFARISLLLGGRVVILPRFDAEAVLRAVDTYQVTHVHLVPTMMHRLLQLPEATRRRYRLDSLSAVQHAAAPCPPEVKRAMIEWWGPIVDEYFGSTEAGVCTYITSGEALARPGSVGRAIEGVTVRVLDAEGRQLAPGRVGDVCVGTDASRGFDYHGASRKLADARCGELFRTGDMGYLDDEGYLYLVDRRADLVISGGVNIYPAEVETALVTHPAVRDCAVFGIPDDEWGERLHAAVQLEPGFQPSEAELVDHLAGRLARYKLPRSMEFVAELPREPSGKIFKRKLREPFWRDRTTAIG